MDAQPDIHDNSRLIYEHAEKAIEKVNKTVDNVTGKLTTCLGFSGVLLKFASDMPSDGWLFSLKVCVTTLLLGGIMLCGCGLYPKAAGSSLTTSYLRNNLYHYPEEEFRRLVIDQRLESINQLEKLAEFRRNYLGLSIVTQ